MSHLFTIYLWILNDFFYTYTTSFAMYYIHMCLFLYTPPLPWEIWPGWAAVVEGGFLLPGLQILSAVPGGHEEGSATGLRGWHGWKAGISTVNVWLGFGLIGACCDGLMKSGWRVKFVQQNESKPCFDRLGHMWNENSLCLMYGFYQSHVSETRVPTLHSYDQ